jgi:hypothetical protein
MDRFQSLFVAAALMAVALPIAACNVDVRKDESPDGKANVDITTPVGNVSVRTNGDTPAIGLAVYPGAKPLREENAPEKRRRQRRQLAVWCESAGRQVRERRRAGSHHRFLSQRIENLRRRSPSAAGM